MKYLVFLLFFVLSINLSYSQEDHSTSEKSRALNFIGLSVGNTTIIPSNFYIPTVGLEYFREVHHNFGVGLITEFELGSHIIQVNEEDHVVSEVKRECAFLILPMVGVRVYKDLLLKVGYGVELEKNHNMGLLKVGVEYVLYLRDPNWRVLPSLSWDHTKYFDGIVYGITFGYVF